MFIIKRCLYNINLWIKESRAPFFTGSIIPVLLGSVLAWYDTSSFLWLDFWLTLIGIVLIHAGTNMANDYFDHISGCDEVNQNPTPFSGGSRMIQNGLIAPKKVLYASLISLSIGSGIGLYLNYISGRNIILILGIIGLFLAFFYTANPFKIAYKTFGELAVGIGFGPLIVMGSYYVQAQNLSIREFLVSLPIGILIALILYINEFPDYESDKKVGKNTLVVILGKKRAITLYHIFLFATYLVIILLVVFRSLPYLCLIVLISLPISIKAFIVSRKNFDKIYELLPANAYTIKLHSSIGLLLCIGIILDKILR
ncbi:MAG: 1,4-dihydroxy-2-naphthoate octaprenyltransferase [Candidatus Poribacteria bacterium]